MGALETLYALVYGKTPGGGGESDLLAAPDRLKMYAIQKLLQGNQVIGDYHDWMNDLDIEQRAREGRSFDEDYLDEDTRKRISSSRQEYARKKMEELQATRVAGAEKSGEVAQERGGSPYRAAEVIPESIARPSFDQIPVGGRKPQPPSDGFSDTDFGSLARRYVADAEAEEKAEAERRYNSVNIDIPGGYESLQRIARQAIAKGRGGGELVFGDPDEEQHRLMGDNRSSGWPFPVSRQYPDTTGVSVPGGTFSQMGGNFAGGDTTESLRRYADEFKRNQTAIKIATIEASAPAKYRSPATNEYLKMLYEKKADEEAQEVAAMNAAANIQNAAANERRAETDAVYYGGKNEADIEVERIKAAADIDIERIKSKGGLMAALQPLLNTLGGDPTKGGNPQLFLQVSKIVALAETPQQAYDEILQLIGTTPGAKSQTQLAETDHNLFWKPEPTTP